MEKNKKSNIKALVLIFVLSTVIMTIFQTVKHFLRPEMTLYGSHFLTIIFAAISATIISYFLIKKRDDLIAEILIKDELRKHAEEIEHEKNELLRLTTDSAKSAIIIINDEGYIIFWNVAAERLFGFTKEEIVNKRLSDYIIPNDFIEPHNTGLNLFKKNAFDDSHGKTIEISAINKDGKEFPIDLSVSSIELKGKKHAIGIINDISQRKKIELELKKSEERMRNFIEDIPIGVYRTMPNGKILFSNPAMIKMLGYSSLEDLQQRDIEQEGYESPDIRKKFKEMIETEGQIKAFEEVFLKKDGSKIYVNEYASAVRDENGNIKYYSGVIEDITERKKAEEELTKLRKAVENSGEAIFITDKEGIIVYINPEFTHLYGWQASEVIGEVTPRILKSGTMDDDHYGIFWRMILEKHKISGEFTNRTKDGKLIDIESTVNPILSEDGKIEGFLSIQRDISRRKKNEVEIRRLSNVVEQSSNSIVITDIDGNIIYVNPWFERITGYSFEEVLGKNPRILKSGTNDPEIYIQMWNTLALGKVWKGEFCNKKKNGDFYWESVTISPVSDSMGSIISYVAIKDDITLRKKLDEALVASERRLKELNLTKDKFFSIIAHDLKSSLGGFRNILSLMNENYDDFEENEKKDIIIELSNSSRAIYNLLENLLSWANSQTGRIKFEPDHYDINDIINRCISLLTGSTQNKSISIDTDLSQLGNILIDANMIYTVIRNLLSNAIKFTRENGNISISTSESNGIIEVAVKDNGLGMSKETINKLFRLDVHQSSLGTNDEKGTGLGLILCKEFVEKHDGRIWIESELGTGSTFHFTIPRRE